MRLSAAVTGPAAPPRGLDRRDFLRATTAALLASALRLPAAPERMLQADICVYGATASGICAALAAAREGRRAVLVEPSRWLGGMTGGGLMHIDWGRRDAVGGLAREILRDGTTDPAYRREFARRLRERSIEVVFEHRVALVLRERNALRTIVLDYAPPDALGCPAPAATKPAALSVSARVYVDASYEGDLMAKAGVSHTWGREGREQYGESLAGVRPAMGVYAVDPYVQPGNPRSGVLPLLQDMTMGPEGSADRLTMGYGFRFRFTDQPAQLPITAPEDYDPATFELYRRSFQRGIDVAGRKMHRLGVYEREPAQLYSLGAGNLSRSLISPTVFGCNSAYPDGDWSTRAKIWRGSQEYLRGLTHFLRTEPFAPPAWRERARRVGFAPGSFDETAGWPHQLYVREARRLVADYVLTQHDVAGEAEVADPVGLASYGVDDWPYATHPCAGGVALQGGDFSMLYLDQAHRGIYGIPYRAITPRENECRNLLVPVCCSASHIAMTSLRMEPVWMTLGESAGVAAALACEKEIAVQRIAYAELRPRLLARGLVLDRPRTSD